MASAKLELLDIFSYSCMNCLRSLDYIKRLDNKYKKYSLKTTLIHPPEWGFEKDSSNILRAAKRYKIRIPIRIDKDKKIIKRLKINFWPAQMLIKDKKILYAHIGEGNYRKLEDKIRRILKAKTNAVFNNEPEYTKFPAVYAGKKKNGIISAMKEKLVFGKVYKTGKWLQNNESLQGKGSLAIKTKGKAISFVAGSINKSPIKINIKLNKKLIKNITINAPRLYDLIKLKRNRQEILGIETKSRIAVYSFAFQ